ncbi:MAG: Crp/Fnr family transcriptional regulator, partial [Anaerolineae bacterium]
MSHVIGPDLARLRCVPYFRNLPAEVLEALAAIAIERHYDRGQVIFLEGEPCAGLHLVAQGHVKIYKLSSQGREQVLHQVGPGDTFNDVAAMDGGPNPASAAALSDVVLYVIPRRELRRLAEAYPQLAWALLESISRRARHLAAMVEDLSLRSVKERLARLLLAEAARTPPAGPLDRSQMMIQAEMAARLGTVREMISRTLRELADEGLIAFDRHRIVILDRE